MLIAAVLLCMVETQKLFRLYTIDGYSLHLVESVFLLAYTGFDILMSSMMCLVTISELPCSVGLSNIFDRERREDLSGSSLMKGTHGAGVAATLVGNFLNTKVGKGIETARIIETLLILTMTAFHLPIMTRSIGTDELVAYAHLSSRCLKEGFQVTLAARKAIGELKTVIGLDTLDGNTLTGKMCNDLA